MNDRDVSQRGCSAFNCVHSKASSFDCATEYVFIGKQDGLGTDCVIGEIGGASCAHDVSPTNSAKIASVLPIGNAG